MAGILLADIGRLVKNYIRQGLWGSTVISLNLIGRILKINTIQHKSKNAGPTGDGSGWANMWISTL